MSTIWAAQWRSNNKLDGEKQHLIRDPFFGIPLLFCTKRECMDHIRCHYGHIARRPDLRNEPHGWRMPRPVKVKVELVAE